MDKITSQNVRVAWAEFSVLYRKFSEIAETIARKRYPKGLLSVEFEFEEGGAVVEIYHSQDSDWVRISLQELEDEIMHGDCDECGNWGVG